MLPRGSQRQKRWRSHPPLPRKKKKEARPRGSSRSKRGMTKPTPIQDGTEKACTVNFSNTCMCYEGWDYILERKFVIIIKLLNCFIFSLEFGLCLQWKRRKEELFWRGFMDVTAQKCHIAPD
jgi:hypothetical protein